MVVGVMAVEVMAVVVRCIIARQQRRLLRVPGRVLVVVDTKIHCPAGKPVPVAAGINSAA